MKRWFWIFLVLASQALAQSRDYELWLRNEGLYLLSPEQKEKLKSLPDMEKELFIQEIWAALDPDPITPQNEFQIEYEKRFQYVKKHFGVPSDRAKIYLLLGPPNSVVRHPNSDRYYPLELWSYYSLGHRNLPPSLELIFFKRWGVGDYRLYSPVFDGLKAITPSDLDLQNPRIQAQLRTIFDPDILQAAEHLTLGASPMESEVIRATLQAPDAIRKVLQKQRPTVETTIVYQGFLADVYTYSVPYEGSVFRTSIAITVPPNYLTFEHDKDKDIYQGRVDLIGKILDEDGKEIVRINDSPALKMSQSEFEKAKAYYFSYLFDTYLLPGKYDLECIFRDYVSNAAGKVEKTFEIKALSGDLELTVPLMSFKSAPASQEQAPFAYNWQQYYPKENFTFNNGNAVILFTKLLNPRKQKLEGTWRLQMAVVKDGSNVLEANEDIPLSTNSDVTFIRKIKLESLIPGPYVFSFKLSQQGISLTTEIPLKIASGPEIFGRLRVVPQSSLTPENFHTNLALQFLYQNKLEEAAKHTRIALDFAPSSYTARSLSARVEKARGNLDAAITLYEKLVQESPGDSEGFFLIGKWSLEKNDWKKASDNFKRALTAGYYTTEILNDLALAEIRLGNTTQALDYWEKSLALNSNQPDIRKQIETYKR